MTFANFLATHNIDATQVVVEQSKKNCYNDTNVKIMWVTLPVEVQGQDYLVLSATAAERVIKKELRILSCDAKFSLEANCYGIVCPKDVNVLRSEDYL